MSVRPYVDREKYIALARRVEELEADLDALLALGRALALWRDPPASWSGLRADQELMDRFQALSSPLRERLEGEDDAA